MKWARPKWVATTEARCGVRAESVSQWNNERVRRKRRSSKRMGSTQSTALDGCVHSTRGELSTEILLNKHML